MQHTSAPQGASVTDGNLDQELTVRRLRLGWPTRPCAVRPHWRNDPQASDVSRNGFANPGIISVRSDTTSL